MKDLSLDYATRPAFFRRHVKLILVLTTAASLAAIWFVMTLYYEMNEPIWSHTTPVFVYCRVFPIALMGGCLTWLAFVAFFLRPRRLALVLLALGLPLSVLGTRDGWNIMHWVEEEVSGFVPPPVN